MNQKKYNKLITAVSVLIPLVVALLLFLKWDADKLVFDLRAPNSEPITLIENLPIAKPLKSLPSNLLQYQCSYCTASCFCICCNKEKEG